MNNVMMSQWRSLPPPDKNHYRGLWGEHFLNVALNEHLGAVRFDGFNQESAAYLFDRIHVPSYDDKTTEIDTLLVCQKGVFVLEVKSWSGQAIYGEEDAHHWFTARNDGDSVSSAMTSNPFAQNRHHLRHISKLLPKAVRENALFDCVLLVDAMPYALSNGNWAGEELERLYTSVHELLLDLESMPVIMSYNRVQSLAQSLVKYQYGAPYLNS